MTILKDNVFQFFKNKSKNIIPYNDWEHYYNQEHAVAFTVSKINNVSILKDIHKGIAESLKKGEAFETFKKKIEKKLNDKWVTSSQRWKTIFETNTRTARAAGQWKRIAENQTTHPFLLYSLGPSRNHRETHVGWVGTLLKSNNSFWETHTPPNGFGCKCYLRNITDFEANKIKKNKGIITTAPKEKYYIYKGEKIPEGISKTFSTNFGKNRLSKTQDLLFQKVKGLPFLTSSKILQQTINKNNKFFKSSLNNNSLENTAAYIGIYNNKPIQISFALAKKENLKNIIPFLANSTKTKIQNKLTVFNLISKKTIVFEIKQLLKSYQIIKIIKN